MSIDLMFEITISVIMIIFAFLTIESKRIINSIIYLSFLSMTAVIGYVVMKAPDVAITEAVIGSGLITALFLFTLPGGAFNCKGKAGEDKWNRLQQLF